MNKNTLIGFLHAMLRFLLFNLQQRRRPAACPRDPGIRANIANCWTPRTSRGASAFLQMKARICSLLMTSLLILFFSTMGHAYQKQIAITIDDLPFVGTTHNKPGNLGREQDRFTNMMNALAEKKVPAIGFVIGGTIERDQWQLLEKFHNHGFEIGNHTHTHKNLNTTSAENYIQDIDRADKVLTPLMTQTKYFRYPYLAEGNGGKKEQVRQYLTSRNYIIAPVTIDSKDFKFNAQILAIHWKSRLNHINSIKTRYLDYIWKQTLRAEQITEKKYGKPMPQILLIHANFLNSYLMGDIIDMYQKNGYEIVTLDKAMKEYASVPSEPSPPESQSSPKDSKSTQVRSNLPGQQ